MVINIPQNQETANSKSTASTFANKEFINPLISILSRKVELYERALVMLTNTFTATSDTATLTALIQNNSYLMEQTEDIRNQIGSTMTQMIGLVNSADTIIYKDILEFCDTFESVSIVKELRTIISPVEPPPSPGTSPAEVTSYYGRTIWRNKKYINAMKLYKTILEGMV